MVSSRFYLACIKNTGKRETALVLARTYENTGKRETALVLARIVLVRTTGETRVRVQIFFLRMMSFCMREVKVAWF